MKTTNDMIKYLKHALPALVLLLAGCVKEPLAPGGGQNADQVTITVTIPGLDIPSTRSMDGAKENQVETVDLLVFDDSPTPKLLQYVRGSVKGVSQEAGLYTATFSANLAECSNARVMVLANMGAFNFGQFTAGTTTKPQVLAALTVANTGKWLFNTDSYKAIPMYGETPSTVTIVRGQKISGVTLRRMLARIDVKNQAANFKLTDIYLYYYNQAGYVAPAWNATTGELTPPTNPPATNIPASPNKSTGNASSWQNNSGYTALEGEIYTFESAPQSEAAFDPNATCLVLGGYYNGGAQKTWYRVDFTAPNDDPAKTDASYLPLLRNHRYIVTVTEVNAAGYTGQSGVYEAARNKGMINNFKTFIQHYDEGEMTDIVYNGNYWLALQPEVRVPYNAVGTLVTNNFQTNQDSYLNGSIISTTADYSWTFSDGDDFWVYGEPTMSYANGKGVVSIRLRAITTNPPEIQPSQNMTGNERSITVTIRVGALTHSYKVVQDAAPSAKVYWYGQPNDPVLHLNPKRTSGSTALLRAERERIEENVDVLLTPTYTGYVKPIISGRGISNVNILMPRSGSPLPNATYTLTATSSGGTQTFTMIDKFPYHTAWAGSNIYWDPTLNGGRGGMTFAATPGDGSDPDHPEYNQGLFFRPGGVYGLRPNQDYDVAKVNYRIGGEAAAIQYFDLPRVGVGTGHLVNANYPLLTEDYMDVANGKGDICKALALARDAGTIEGIPPGNWRLPTPHEFFYLADQVTSRVLSAANFVGGFATVTVPPGDGPNAWGQYKIRSGVRLRDYPDDPSAPAPFFPKSGFLYSYTYGVYGPYHPANWIYWTSGIGSSSVNFVYVYEGYNPPAMIVDHNSSYNDTAMPVRCVRD